MGRLQLWLSLGRLRPKISACSRVKTPLGFFAYDIAAGKTTIDSEVVALHVWVPDSSVAVETLNCEVTHGHVG